MKYLCCNCKNKKMNDDDDIEYCPPNNFAQVEIGLYRGIII